jgi:hypothetical protein
LLVFRCMGVTPPRFNGLLKESIEEKGLIEWLKW